LGTNSFQARIKDIKEILDTQVDIEYFNDRLVFADKMEDPEEAQAKREGVQPELDKAIRQLE
jgi:hypothetical protein